MSKQIAFGTMHLEQDTLEMVVALSWMCSFQMGVMKGPAMSALVTF